MRSNRLQKISVAPSKSRGIYKGAYISQSYQKIFRFTNTSKNGSIFPEKIKFDGHREALWTYVIYTMPKEKHIEPSMLTCWSM